MDADRPSHARAETLLFALAGFCFVLAWWLQSRLILLLACGLAVLGHGVGVWEGGGRRV
jgi:uncharacterized membrane protein